MDIQIHPAGIHDAPSIARMISELVATYNENSPITISYVETYLASPGSHVLLAEVQGEIVGLLSYSLHPNLYHAADCCTIEELVVQEDWRSRGVGGALIDALLAGLDASRMAEVSVSTLFENQGARRFYQAHGFTDEALLLEKHLGKA